MAFAKAKMQRFNEVIGCAPPPGTYQPKWQEKPLLGVFEKGRRFNDEKLKLEMNDTPIKTPALLKKEHHFKSWSSRKQTSLKEELFSNCATSFEKDENGVSIQQKTCSCNLMIDDIARKYEETIESLGKRLMDLSKYEETDSLEESKSSDSDKVNTKYSPDEAESTRVTMSQSYQQEIIEYRLRIAKLQDTIDCITTEKNVLSIDCFKMKKHIGELEEKIKIKNMEVLEAESLAESESKSIEMLKLGIHHLKANLEDSNSQIEDLKLKLDNTKQELAMEKSKVEELKAVYENALINAEKEVSRKSEEIEDLTSSLKEKISTINQEKRIQAEQVEIVSNELNMIKQLYNADQVRHKELEDELNTTRKELATAKSKIDDLSSLREGIESVLQDTSIDIGDTENNVFMIREHFTVDAFIHFLKSIIKENNEVGLLNKELEREIEKKESYIQNLEQLIGPFREQLENYEQERQALEKLTKQTKGEFEALSLQHAALLGHQNHKQKIQYMVKLKEKNLHLMDEIEDLRGKLRQKEKIITKISNQIKDEPKTPKALHRSRKENTVSNSQ